MEPDRDALYEAKKPTYPHPDVQLRVWRVAGLRVVIQSERRAQVEGLAKEMSDVLSPGAPKLSKLDMEWVAAGIFGLGLLLGPLLGDRVPEWIGVSQANGVVDRWEGLGMALGLVTVVALTAFLIYTFPTLQILDDGEIPRASRARKVLLSILGALALTLLGLVLDRVL